MLEIDSIAYNSKIYKADPIVKIAIGIIPLIICIFFNEMSVSLLTIFLMSGITIYESKISISTYMKVLSIPMIFIIMGTVTIIICNVSKEENSWTIIKIFGENYGISKKSLTMGILLILRSLGAISCMYFISLNTTIMDIAYAVQKFKVPSLIVSLMVLIYRYIFVIFEEASKMSIAKNARAGTKTEGFIDRMNSFGSLMGALFIRCLDRCDKIYMALLSRGFDGNLRMITPEYDNSNNKNLLAFGAVCILLQMFLGFMKRGIK